MESGNQMKDLQGYVNGVLSGFVKTFATCEVFAKVLTRNDDSGRHGVLIPGDAYSFFPYFDIPDLTANATLEFAACNTVSGKVEELAYKYYQRYPERRITRLPKLLDNHNDSRRMLVFFRVRLSDGGIGYCFDCADSETEGRFDELYRIIFGNELAVASGSFVIRSVDSKVFSLDAALTDLLVRFDNIKDRGWIDEMRTGDTGIGYTFETLLGIKENNDQKADFRGIEIKCKGVKEGCISSSGKLNLFQAGPTWLAESKAKDRIRVLGKEESNGLFACYSQVTTSPNNLGLLLELLWMSGKIDLKKNSETLGYWTFERLWKRLEEKHSRAAFVKARVRTLKGIVQYSYEELIYCTDPSIERFVDLIAARNIVFELMMSENARGRVRNHGYPWRLTRAEFLDQLFAFQIKLR